MIQILTSLRPRALAAPCVPQGAPKFIRDGSLPWSPSSPKISRLMADDHPSFWGKHGKAKSNSGHSGP